MNGTKKMDAYDADTSSDDTFVWRRSWGWRRFVPLKFTLIWGFIRRTNWGVCRRWDNIPLGPSKSICRMKIYYKQMLVTSTLKKLASFLVFVAGLFGESPFWGRSLIWEEHGPSRLCHWKWKSNQHRRIVLWGWKKIDHRTKSFIEAQSFSLKSGHSWITNWFFSRGHQKQ